MGWAFVTFEMTKLSGINKPAISSNLGLVQVSSNNTASTRGPLQEEQFRIDRPSLYTAISIKVVPRAKRKSRIRARKAAGNR